MHQALAIARETQPVATMLRLARRVDSTEEFPLVVRKMLDYFDGKRTLEQVCALAQISVGQGQAIVRKLTGLGILTTARPAEPCRSGLTLQSDFSAEEEAFFSSEVKPIDECDEPFESLSERVNLFLSELMLKLRGSPAV